MHGRSVRKQAEIEGSCKEPDKYGINSHLSDHRQKDRDCPMTKFRPFPEPHAHGEIEMLFTDIYFVTGTAQMGGRLPMRFSRNMSILRHKDDLTLVNSVRLSEAGLSDLDKLGTVKHVIRLAGFHGMDDPFYQNRYGARVWSVDAPYLPGFSEGSEPYLEPDVVLAEETILPVEGARLLLFKSSKPKEGLLLLEREGGIVISGDCLQNWGKTDRYFSLPAKILMPIMGFIKPHNIGPGWRKVAKPDTAEIKANLDIEFAHVLPAHGAPVIGDAKDRYAPALAGL